LVYIKAFAFYGVLVLAVAIIWWALARDLQTEESSADIAMKSVFLRLIRVRNVQIALALGLLTFAVLHSFIGWLPKIIENNGFSPSMAGYFMAGLCLAIFGLSSLIRGRRAIAVSF
jgi:cyanate permease